MNGRRRLIGSFNHGSMANALPQAIGVQAAHPGRQVVTLSGDGGLAMLLGELLTLRQQRAAGEGRRVQQRRAVVRRARDEGGRLRHLRHRPRQPQLRRDRRGGRAPRRPNRASERTRRRPAVSLRARWPGGGRGHDRPAGAVPPATHHSRAGQGLCTLGSSYVLSGRGGSWDSRRSPGTPAVWPSAHTRGCDTSVGRRGRASAEPSTVREDEPIANDGSVRWRSHSHTNRSGITEHRMQTLMPRTVHPFRPAPAPVAGSVLSTST